jgi:hypothetical protein
VAKILHCGLTLVPVEEKIFTPMLSIPVKYRGVTISLLESFEAVSLFQYRCNGTCSGEVYAWQGIGYDGVKSEVEPIRPRDVEDWKKMSGFGRDANKTGASAVQGSQRVWPFRFKEMVPV